MLISRPESKRRPYPKSLAVGLFASTLLMMASASAIEPFSAVYQANYMGLKADGTMTLEQKEANRWEYTLKITNNIAQLMQSTIFEDKNGQWRPLSSEDSSVVLIKKSDKNAIYDWTKGVANWTGDVKPDRTGPLKLEAGDMDAMLINLALARDVTAGKPLQYRMIEDGRATQLTYTVAGKESITIAGKSQQATKVMRTDGNKQTIAWVVPNLPVPARILQKKDGKDDIDLRIKSML